VDLKLPEIASSRYEQLLTAYIPDTKYEGSFVHKTPKAPTQITLTHTYIEERIGTQVSETTVMDTLTRLGFTVLQNKSEYTVTVPSWRDTGDVGIPADIVEEVARMV
jgi:phenylalanyl-tRNA synthetase beta subunit